MTIKSRQITVFIVMLACSAILAAASYHHLRREWIMYRKGERLMLNRDYEGAIPFLAAARGISDTNPRVLKDLGLACIAAGRFPEAADAFRAYLKHDPLNRGARIQLARALFWSGRYHESAVEYKTALGEHP